jgi:hypothetical protein
MKLVKLIRYEHNYFFSHHHHFYAISLAVVYRELVS